MNNPRIMIGAMVVASLTAMGTAGAILAPAISAADPASGAMTTLMGVLPKGFSSSNCQPPNDAPQGALATVDCDQNTLANGPSGGRFSLYANQSALDSHFQSGASVDVAAPCPGGRQSPGPWSYTNGPGGTGGQLICGTYNGTPDLMWSDNAKLLLGDMQGSDINSLYQFWSSNTG